MIITVNSDSTAIFLTYLKWDSYEQREIIISNKLM